MSEGLSLILENATRLHEASQVLASAKQAQGYEILTSLAEEEAAKFLILIDAVRCPKTFPERGRHLGYFHDHLARGIYARLADARPIDLAELQRYAESERETLYLDGPNDVDWIFRNRILAGREETMYVDYVETSERHKWLAPRNDEFLVIGPSSSIAPFALTISNALYKTGMTSPNGLAVVAKIWRPVKVHSGLRWEEVEAKNRETLKELEHKRLPNPDYSNVYGQVVQRWPFPLYTLDLCPKKVDRKILVEIQETWRPD